MQYKEKRDEVRVVLYLIEIVERWAIEIWTAKFTHFSAN